MQRPIDKTAANTRDGTNGHPGSDEAATFERLRARRLSAVFLLLAAIITLTGGVVFRDLSQAILQHENERLVAVADLKKGQIGEWLAERRHDAHRTAASPLLHEALQAWFDQPPGERNERLAAWLEFVRATNGYASIEVLDSQGARLFVAGTPPHADPDLHRSEVRQALHQTQPVLIDFHRDPRTDIIHLGYAAAIRDAFAPQEPPLGVMVFAIDPRPYLYPFLQSWPGPSPSGETLLVRQEGDAVVFLNELRHRSGTALRLRLPLAQANLPAAQALRHGEGLFEGRDYRGVPVLSVLRQIADSPWFLVTKIDRAEVVRDIHNLAAISALVGLLAIGGGGALLVLVWQRQRLANAQALTRQAQTIAELSARFHALVEGASDAFFANDEGGRFVAVNRRACESTGYTREELLSMAVPDVSPDFDLATARAGWQQLQAGEGLTVQANIRRKDGSLFPAEVRVSTCDFEEQRLVLAVVRDISERLRGEQALRESEYLYRELVNNMSAGVAVYEAVDDGRDFVIRDLNRGGEKIGQIPREQAVGRRVTDVFPGVCDLGLLEVFTRVWRSGQPERHPINLYHDDRLFLWVENYVFKLPGDQIVAVYDDTSARYQAEMALRESEADLKRAQSVGHIGSWHLDVQRDELHWSDETFRIFGIAPGMPLTYAAFLAAVHPQDRAYVDSGWQAALRGEAYEIEHRIVVESDVRWVRERAELEFDAKGKLLSGFGIVEDITERKQAEEALLRRTEELQRLNSELEEFAYVASHDLKAPLRAVANLALVIDEDVAEGLDEENRRRLKLLRERVKVMHALIEGLLSYARLGRRERSTRPVVLQDLLRDLVESLSMPTGFRIECEGPLPTLIADPTELSQIFQNLLGNAMDHHDHPELGHAWVRAYDCERYWCLEVADDGPGISKDMKAELFRMFVTGGKAGHTGIGLAVVRKLVLANSGQIEVDDNLPRGTQFRIQWPKG